jgi:hypothetical protein
MPAGKRREQEPNERIRTLAAHKLVLIEDFVEFPCQPHEKAPARKSRDCGFGDFGREALGTIPVLPSHCPTRIAPKTLHYASSVRRP